MPVIQWSPDKPFVLDVIKQNRPVVLRNTAATKWPALRKWTPQYLITNTRGKQYDFRTAINESVFIYSQRKPLDQLPELEFRKPWNITYMTLSDFFDSITSNITNEKTYHYFTGCIARSQDNLTEFSFSRDASPLYYFIANEGTLDQSRNVICFCNYPNPPNLRFFRSELMVRNTPLSRDSELYDLTWRLGTPGVVAQTHYDEAPNFAIQIYGHKRWILSPPSEAPKLYGIISFSNAADIYGIISHYYAHY